jgi:serine/threonine protein kinase
VLNQLAKGGQGITTRVRRKRDNTIWVMKESYVDSTKAGNSALREAKTLQSLNHPYINRYQDVFLHQDGGDLVVCTVMEYCEGGDLAHYLIAFKRHNMIIEPDRALRWMQQMCSALAYLHSHKVVHRDLKPQNIFMMTEDSLRVGDFGLAQTIERGKRTSQVGTPCYMAPEVLHHDAYAESVDIWGLGCIGLEAITLNFLWERKGMLAAQVLTDPIHASSMSPEYPACLRESIAKCLVHGANKRPSAAMLEGALFSAMERAGDQSGLVEVIGNLAQQWTSWLSPQGNNQALGITYSPHIDAFAPLCLYSPKRGKLRRTCDRADQRRRGAGAGSLVADA